MVLPPLHFAQFRFLLRAASPLLLPARNKGNTLRGAFGTMLRKLCCHPGCPGAARCEFRATCTYAQVFEPAAPEGSPALSNYQAIPRPFVIRPPLEEKTGYQPGETVEFGLILVGRAIEFLPYFVLTFNRLGEEGLGVKRARCALERVEQLEASGCATAVVYDGGTRVMRPAAGSIREVSSACASQSRALQVRFLTPTFLVFEGHAVREPHFHHLVRRLRDRLNALATFYCGGPLVLDFKGLGERAAAVLRTHCDLRWMARQRQSSRTGRRHDVSGFVGTCAFAGDLAEFLPLLHFGQYLHVGKHTAWGNGWLSLQAAEQTADAHR